MRVFIIILIWICSCSNHISAQSGNYFPKTDTIGLNLFRNYSINAKKDTGYLYEFIVRNDSILKEGYSKEFYSNGQEKSHYVYKDGKLYNVVSIHDFNGNNLDPGKLKNGEGTINVYGEPISGFTYNIADYFEPKPIITIQQEYKNGVLNGYTIQYFNYPTDTASISIYKNGTIKEYRAFHRNGKLSQIDKYNDQGERKVVNQWNGDGILLDLSLRYNNKNDLYYISDTICNGLVQIYGEKTNMSRDGIANIYFSNGKLDSILMCSLFKGDQVLFFRYNFQDSSRVYFPDGKKGYRSFKITSMNRDITFKNDNYDLGINLNEKFIKHGKWVEYFYGTDIISSETYFLNDSIVSYKAYNKNGEIIDEKK